MKKKLKNIVQENTVDGLISSVKSYSISATSDRFFATFIDEMQGYFKIRLASDIKVLAYLCRIAEYNSGMVYMTTSRKREIKEVCNLKNRQNLSNAFKRLTNLGLIAGKDDEWMLSPKVFWKGDTDSRAKLLLNNGLEVRMIFKENPEKEEVDEAWEKFNEKLKQLRNENDKKQL